MEESKLNSEAFIEEMLERFQQDLSGTLQLMFDELSLDLISCGHEIEEISNLFENNKREKTITVSMSERAAQLLNFCLSYVRTSLLLFRANKSDEFLTAAEQMKEIANLIAEGKMPPIPLEEQVSE